MERVMGSFRLGEVSIQLLEHEGHYKVKQLVPDSRVHFTSEDWGPAFEEFLARTRSELENENPQ